jgi:hypothetical protein
MARAQVRACRNPVRTRPRQAFDARQSALHVKTVKISSDDPSYHFDHHHWLLRSPHQGIRGLKMAIGQCGMPVLKHRNMLVPSRPEMLIHREDEDEAHRQTQTQEATVMLDGVRRTVDDIAAASHCAADRHVRLLVTTGYSHSYGTAEAHIERFSTEHGGGRIGTGARQIAQSGSKGTDIDQNTGGRDRVQL